MPAVTVTILIVVVARQTELSRCCKDIQLEKRRNDHDTKIGGEGAEEEKADEPMRMSTERRKAHEDREDDDHNDEESCNDDDHNPEHHHHQQPDDHQNHQTWTMMFMIPMTMVMVIRG